MSPESAPYFLIAFVLGIALASLLLLRKRRVLEAELVANRERKEELEKTAAVLEADNRQIPGLQSELKRLNENVIRPIESDRARLSTLADERFQSIEKLERKIATFDETDEAARNKNQELHTENEKLKAQLNAKHENFIELQQAREELARQFESIAHNLLKEKSKEFTDTNKAILDPIKEEIEAFKKKIDEVYDKESKERFSLGREVDKLVQLNIRISEDANNLTKALTSNSKVQGDWGEWILESILETSGLVRDREYFAQNYLRDKDGNVILDENGKKMRPDFRIVYPDGREVIIDSKASLSAYNRYVSCATEQEAKIAIAEHLTSIRKHIDELSAIKYQDHISALDYVMMFVPIEPAYFLAIHTDNKLWDYAYKQRVLLTSPSNLVVALKLIVDLWKRDNEGKHYQKIVERAGLLYDKFDGFVRDLIGVGKKMDEAKGEYEDAMKKLSAGPGNLVRQTEELKKLGAKATKQLPSALVERASESISLEILAAGSDDMLLAE
ncbi:MAG TPA: DNA recombination protein RmuC [Candidatus Kapabacteria bacterium]|nr:DNA recombination protein RmuC [Candidatus Kapabacteria bacterium]